MELLLKCLAGVSLQARRESITLDWRRFNLLPIGFIDISMDLLFSHCVDLPFWQTRDRRRLKKVGMVTGKYKNEISYKGSIKKWPRCGVSLENIERHTSFNQTANNSNGTHQSSIYSAGTSLKCGGCKFGIGMWVMHIQRGECLFSVIELKQRNVHS